MTSTRNALVLCPKRDIHADRFIKALESRFQVTVLTSKNPSLEDVVTEPDLIIYFPLSLKISNYQSFKKTKMIGISLGYDLNVELQDNHLRTIIKANLRKSHAVIVDSEHGMRILTNLGFPDNLIRVIPYGCDFEFYKNVSSSDFERSVIVTRNWSKIHGNETILKALTLLPNGFFTKITFSGRGLKDYEGISHLTSITQTISNLNFIDGVNPKEMRELFRSHTLYISAAESDGTSISMLEAMSSARIVLVSDFSSNLEWIMPGYNGFVFQNRSATSLADKVSEIFQVFKQDELEKIRTRARDSVSSRGDWDTNSKRFLLFIESQISETP